MNEDDFRRRVRQFEMHVRALAGERPHFVEFYNRVVCDLVPRLFSGAERRRLELTAEWRGFLDAYAQLSQLPKARRQRGPGHAVQITPRIPGPLKDELEAQARELGISQNELWIRKLAAPLAEINHLELQDRLDRIAELLELAGGGPWDPGRAYWLTPEQLRRLYALAKGLEVQNDG